MNINGVTIDNAFAEAFGMKATRILITAHNLEWAYHAANAATGFATSVIACGCEAGIERELGRAETPDGRPGLSVLLFATSGKELVKQLERRVGQCVLTSPTSAVFAGAQQGEPMPLGKHLRYFGDGFQTSKLIGGHRYWRIPVMDGDFLIQDTTDMVSGVGGGNFLVLAESQEQALTACEAAVASMRQVRDVIMPFPGGVVRSGSKVGSKYCGAPGLDQRRLLPHDPRRHRHAADARHRGGARDRDRRADAGRRRLGDAGRHRRGGRPGRGPWHPAGERRGLWRKAGQVPLPAARNHGLTRPGRGPGESTPSCPAVSGTIVQGRRVPSNGVPWLKS